MERRRELRFCVFQTRMPMPNRATATTGAAMAAAMTAGCMAGPLPPSCCGSCETSCGDASCVGLVGSGMSVEGASCSVVGSAETVRKGLNQLVADTKADELMIVTDVFDFSQRVRSLEITAQAAT